MISEEAPHRTTSEERCSRLRLFGGAAGAAGALGDDWLAWAIGQAYASSPLRPDRADAVTNAGPIVRS